MVVEARGVLLGVTGVPSPPGVPVAQMRSLQHSRTVTHMCYTVTYNMTYSRHQTTLLIINRTYLRSSSALFYQSNQMHILEYVVLKLTSLGLIEVLGFAFAGLDPLFLHGQGSWYL